MRNIKGVTDKGHVSPAGAWIFLDFHTMVFSKSFGYVVRGMLYIAYKQGEKRYVQVEEIASVLAIPRHFMGKILKTLVKAGLLASSKGPSGGFAVNEKTMKASLADLVKVTEGGDIFTACALMFKECNSQCPCPIHSRMEISRGQLMTVLSSTTIGDLLQDNNRDLINSISFHSAQDHRDVLNEFKNQKAIKVERL
jgi:Rrf2 family protein